jgi:hypothetical protein|tara:strand:- start:413 stop:754 length:342 start_codon:yes stop_codon:yes gene_type:complete
MSIELRLGTYTDSPEVTVFKVSKIWIDQQYHDSAHGSANDEIFTLRLTETDGREHLLKLYCTDQNTEIELTPDADKRLNGIPRNVRGSIVDVMVPGADANVRTVCSNEVTTAD